jgi:hypothetical protein
LADAGVPLSGTGDVWAVAVAEATSNAASRTWDMGTVLQDRSGRLSQKGGRVKPRGVGVST